MKDHLLYLESSHELEFPLEREANAGNETTGLKSRISYTLPSLPPLTNTCGPYATNRPRKRKRCSLVINFTHDFPASIPRLCPCSSGTSCAIRSLRATYVLFSLSVAILFGAAFSLLFRRSFTPLLRAKYAYDTHRRRTFQRPGKKCKFVRLCLPRGLVRVKENRYRGCNNLPRQLLQVIENCTRNVCMARCTRELTVCC